MPDPGPLIGRGRAADVYDIGGGRVLRRYRTAHDSAPEAAIMALVASHGFPVPAVHDVDGRAIQVLAGLVRTRLLRAFLADVDVDGARAVRALVCERKLRDPHMGSGELDAIRALAASEGT